MQSQCHTHKKRWKIYTSPKFKQNRKKQPFLLGTDKTAKTKSHTWTDKTKMSKLDTHCSYFGNSQFRTKWLKARFFQHAEYSESIVGVIQFWELSREFAEATILVKNKYKQQDMSFKIGSSSQRKIHELKRQTEILVSPCVLKGKKKSDLSRSI